MFSRCAPGLFLAIVVAVPAVAQQSGPQGEPEGKLRRQIHLVPLEGGQLMEMTVFRPPGDGPWPLVVINHGSPGSPAERKTMRPVYSQPSEWFVGQGYAVALPVRRGYGATGGDWAETYGKCRTADFYWAGLETARDINAAVTYMQRQPFVRGDKVVLVGQSAGGWGVIAASAAPVKGVVGVINFAGGRGGHLGGDTSINANENCAPERLIETAGKYGATASVPTLWVYTENDSYFDPKLSRSVFDAYVKAGGKGDYKLMPAFAKDGHSFFGGKGGVEIWSGPVKAFLAPLQ
ncbi:MAG: alpha/beta hydrolase family protein [Ferrovibrionaceae bacterium]